MLLQSQLSFNDTTQWQSLNLKFYVYENYKKGKQKNIPVELPALEHTTISMSNLSPCVEVSLLGTCLSLAVSVTTSLKTSRNDQ